MSYVSYFPEIAVLDMAGTTINDGGLVLQAFQRAMKRAGVDEEHARFADAMSYVRRTMGRSKIDVFTELFDGDEHAATQANRDFEAAYSELVEAGWVTPIPGAEAAIAQLRADGIKIALTTGFSPYTRDGLLDSLGWGSIADLVLSPQDAGRGRPFPDLALTALMRLGGTAVKRVITVGDTVADIQSGVAAGAGMVIGVLTGTHGEEQMFDAGAHAVIASIADLPTLLRDGHMSRSRRH